MEDYLYLDDYINLYSKKNNQIMEIIPYKDTLKYGRIINKEKFIKKMITVLNDLKLNKNIFNNNITVIINKNISLSDKEIITDSLEALNYKKVKFINELDYLKLNKNKIYLVYNYHYFYLYYINFLGKTEILMYENNKINKGLILKILKLLKKNKIFIYGKNYLEVIKIVEKLKYSFYYYEDSKNLLLNLVLKNVKFSN